MMKKSKLDKQQQVHRSNTQYVYRYLLYILNILLKVFKTDT